MTDSLWRRIFCKKQRNEGKGVGFYRRGARKTKRRFDPRYKPIEKRHVSYTINASRQLVRTLYTWRPHSSWVVIQWSSSPSTRDFNRHPIDYDTIYTAFSTVTPMIMSPSTHHFQPSSKLNLSPFMSVSRPSTHEHRTVSMYLFDRHPNWPPSAESNKPNGMKGAIEEDKNENKDRRAWTGGPDGSISMSQRKVKPIPCIEHYIK